MHNQNMYQNMNNYIYPYQNNIYPKPGQNMNVMHPMQNYNNYHRPNFYNPNANQINQQNNFQNTPNQFNYGNQKIIGVHTTNPVIISQQPYKKNYFQTINKQI